MFWNKVIAATTISGILTFSACAGQEQASEVKAGPLVALAAVQTAVAVVQAIWERNNAVTQADIDTLIAGLHQVKEELKAHQSEIFVQEWISNVDGLILSFGRYFIIRQNSGELNALLLLVEQSYAQTKNIFINHPVYASQHAALAFNMVAAIRLAAEMDYSHDDVRIRAIAADVMAVNNRLLSVPAFPAFSANQHGPMAFENCKVMMAPFKNDLRDNVLYSAFGPWTMGYHPGGREFRYYEAGAFRGSCFEGNNGEGAYRYWNRLTSHRNAIGPGAPSTPVTPVLQLINRWDDIAPAMYDQNVAATRANPIYATVKKLNETFKPLTKSYGKGGNNGTVSCDTFCAGSDWGEVGRCIGSFQSNNGNQYSCDTVPGLLSSGSLHCECIR